jgi:hypothetical protein
MGTLSRALPGSTRAPACQCGGCGSGTGALGSGSASARNGGRYPEDLVDAHLGQWAIALRRRDDEVGHHLDLGEHLGVMDAHVQLVVHPAPSQNRLSASWAPSRHRDFSAAPPTHRAYRQQPAVRRQNARLFRLLSARARNDSDWLVTPPARWPIRTMRSGSAAVADHRGERRDHQSDDAHRDRERRREQPDDEPREDDQRQARPHQHEVQAFAWHGLDGRSERFGDGIVRRRRRAVAASMQRGEIGPISVPTSAISLHIAGQRLPAPLHSNGR